MAAYRSLQHMFENPLPENPTLVESLSLSQIKPIKPIEQSSFTEIFGELHFKECPELIFPLSPSSSSSSSLDSDLHKDTVKAPESKSHSKSLRGDERLQLCTEGLGFESSHDVEELKNGMNENWELLSVKEDKIRVVNSSNGENYGRRSKGSIGETQYPPPISCIGKNGKPWVRFRSYRDNGRFVLKAKEFLHAHRENGRLRVNFVQPDDDDVLLQEEAEDEDEDEDEEEEEEEEAAENEQEGEVPEEDSGNGEIDDVDV